MPCGDGDHRHVVVINHHDKIFKVHSSLSEENKWKHELDIVAKSLEVLRPGADPAESACTDSAKS